MSSSPRRKVYTMGSGEKFRRFYAFEMRVPFVISRYEFAQAIAEQCTNGDDPYPETREHAIHVMRSYLQRYGELEVDIDSPKEGERDGSELALEVVDKLFPELKEEPR